MNKYRAKKCTCGNTFLPKNRMHKFCTLHCKILACIVKSDKCWNWTGAKSSEGYGHFTYFLKTYSAHRTAYEVFNNIKIPEGMLVLHSCDNPACCNPKHLRLGTNKDNSVDRDLRGRWANQYTRRVNA